MAYGTILGSQIIEKVRKLLGEQLDEVTGLYPQTVWTDQFLHDGVNQAMDRCSRQGFWFLYKTDATITTTAGNNTYELPSTIQQVEQVFVGTPEPGFEYTPHSPEDFANVIAGRAYTLEANGNDNTGLLLKLKLYPTPTTSGTVVTIRGIGRNTPSANTSYALLSDQYHMFLVWSAVAYAKFREQDREGREKAEEEAEKIWEDIYINEIAPGGSEKPSWKLPWEGPR